MSLLCVIASQIHLKVMNMILWHFFVLVKEGFPSFGLYFILWCPTPSRGICLSHEGAQRPRDEAANTEGGGVDTKVWKMSKKGNPECHYDKRMSYDILCNFLLFSYKMAYLNKFMHLKYVG